MPRPFTRAILNRSEIKASGTVIDISGDPIIPNSSDSFIYDKAPALTFANLFSFSFVGFLLFMRSPVRSCIIATSFQKQA